MTLTHQGPEWGTSQNGSEVFYTAYSADGLSLQLSSVTRNDTGQWHVKPLPQSWGQGAPIPSQDETAPAPNIYWEEFTYTSGRHHMEEGPFGWRPNTVPADDTLLTGRNGPGRWMPDYTKLIHHQRLGSDSTLVQRLAIYDTLTGNDSLLFDSVYSRPAMKAWWAPELNSGMGGTAIITNKELEKNIRLDIEVFQEDGNGGWKTWTTFPSIDSNYPCIESPEVFVFNGHSYVVLVSRPYCNPPLNAPSLIWIASIDPDLPTDQTVRRVVSYEFDPSGVSVKNDPEYIKIHNVNGSDERVWIYYADWGLPTNSKQKKTLTLRVCNVGLLSR